MSPPVVSVVVPVHNNASTIIEQLDALKRALDGAPKTELLVVDNRSTDGSAEAVKGWSAATGVPVRVVDASERAGEPFARNIGWRHALGRHVLYCDGDDVVADSWITSMSAGLDRWPYVTGPVSTDRLNAPRLAAARGSQIFDGVPMLYGTVPYAHGCNMGFRREVLETLGGFDEQFLAGCDQAIAVCAWQHGFELGFAEGALVHYRLRTDLRSTWRQGRSYGRYRVRVRALTPELVDRGELRRAQLRRYAWVTRKAVPAMLSTDLRVRWVWVTSQLVGSLMGRWEARRER